LIDDKLLKVSQHTIKKSCHEKNLREKNLREKNFLFPEWHTMECLQTMVQDTFLKNAYP
jgi:hypothetical protein